MKSEKYLSVFNGSFLSSLIWEGQSFLNKFVKKSLENCGLLKNEYTMLFSEFKVIDKSCYLNSLKVILNSKYYVKRTYIFS